ncbi:hypothetical protein Tsubulata_032565, partial [Turnera subulata]
PITAKPIRLAFFSTQSPPNQPNLEPTTTTTHEAQQQQQQTHDHQVPITDRSYWTKRIHALCTRHRKIDDALRLLESLRLRGYRPDSLNISSIIHALCDAGRFAEAHRRFAISLASSPVPDERTCNVLLARLLDSRTPFSTLNVLCRLVDVKPEFVPSLVNYNRLIDQFCLVSGQPGVGHRLVYDMMGRGHCPSVVTYTTLVNGYCWVGEMGDAFKLFDEMREPGGVAPNSLTWSLLIRGVLRKRDLERGKVLMSELWERMKSERDRSVNNAAFANLVDCLCSEGFFNEVFVIAEDMPQGDSVSEEFSYGVMIDSLCRAGRCHGASRVVYIMRKRGLIPSLVSYNSIVHGLCNEGGCMRAHQLLMEGIEFGYSPSEYTYKALVEALCQAMDLNKASDALQCMLNREGVDRTRAMEVFNRMITEGVAANSTTYTTILEGLCESGQLDEAKKFWDEIIWPSKIHDDFVYAAILKGLCRLASFNEACHFLYELVDSGISPNIFCYNIVIDSACKLGMKREAYQVVGEMRKNGVVPDAVTWRILDKLHAIVREELI